MRKLIPIFILLFMSLNCFVQAQESPTVNVSDIATLEGIRDNQLVGYGLVMGLEGTGDSIRSQPTMQSIANMLENFGVHIPADALRVRNAAAVVVTATLPPFTYPGERIDVTVSSMGDARSLKGGVLLMTPLRAGDNQVYAVAQGSLSIGGVDDVWTSRDSVQHNNVANIPNGALVEREVAFNWHDNERIVLRIREASFNTSSQLAAAINENLPLEGEVQLANPIDPARVEVRIPDYARDNTVDFVATIYDLQIEMTAPARVIVNERTGTVVIGHNVRISPVAIAHEGIKIEITATNQDNEDDEEIMDIYSGSAEEMGEETVMVVEGGTTVMDLVQALNALGASPVEIIAILQAIDRAGALHGVLEIM